jgi:hypothetical protein
MATGITVIGAGGVAGTAATGVTGNAAPGLKKGIAIAIPFLLCAELLETGLSNETSLSTKMAARLIPRGHFASARNQNGRQRPAYQRKP